MIAPLDRKLLRDIWNLKGQLVAISFVIASGIATFVTMLSTMDSLRLAMEGYYSRHHFAQAFASLERAPEIVAYRLAEIRGVSALETRVVADVTLDVKGTREAVTGRLVSLPERGMPRLNGIHLRRGRFPRPGRDDEVVITELFADAHGMQPGAQLSAVINERKKDLRVVGIGLSPEYVYAIKPGAVLPDNRLFGILWMKRRALASAFDMDGAFNDVSFELGHGADEQRVLAEIDDVLEPYGGLGALLRKDQGSHWFLANEFKQLRSTGLFAPAIFLGVAAFLLSVVLARVVGQQREQIAVLKAFGYSHGQIGLHFLKLVLLVTFMAGILGVAGGAWMGREMTAQYRLYFAFPELPYQLQERYLLQALLIGFAAALVGTARAIRSAARLPPAEAMRPLPPASFKPTFIERAGFERWMSMPARMVLRHLERHPVKATLSVLGIGCAVALLVVGNAVMDSMNYGMEAEFNVAQREDMSINLAQPRSRRALDEMRHLPGVLRAEPFRAVAARFVAGPRSWRTALIGRPHDASLRRLINAEIRPVPLPDDGLVLTDKLAARLGVQAGDVVHVEVLQEKRPQLDVPVARVVNAFFGSEAYMDLEALNRRLEEGPVVTGAHLLVDEARLDDLHAHLKNTPQVAGVGLRTEAIRSFKETMAEGMGIMMLFMVLFAAVIACGVVYNNARISLAERSRDLASMRVLGYRRREISLILLGELWTLTILALPVGCILGYGLTALTIHGMENDLYTMPFVIEPRTYGYACLVVLLASVVSSLLVRRRLDRLDLVEVLKSRE